MNSRSRIIVGITGASGAVYARRCLEALREADVETHLVISRAAELTIHHELGVRSRELNELAGFRYGVNDIAAPIASGSFRTMGMIIAPCSVRTMSEIATGVTSSLISRAADVVLKERRRLVLMVRETPLHLGHLQTMAKLAEIGAVIAPPLPAFYAEPASVEDLVDQSVGRTLDLFGIDTALTRRWGEDISNRDKETPA